MWAVEEFCQRWLSGLRPSLSLETAPDGEVRVSCQVHAGGARHADARRYQGREEEQRRESVGGVRYRGAAYERRLTRRARARAENDEKTVEDAFDDTGAAEALDATTVQASDAGGADATDEEAGDDMGAAEALDATRDMCVSFDIALEMMRRGTRGVFQLENDVHDAVSAPVAAGLVTSALDGMQYFVCGRCHKQYNTARGLTH